MDQKATRNPGSPEESCSAVEASLPEGTSRIRLGIAAPPGTRLEIGLEMYSAEGKLLGKQEVHFRKVGGLQQVGTHLAVRISAVLHALESASAEKLAGWLLWASLAIYLVIRLVALPAFPIYFFTDEAAQTVLAADLLRDHWSSSGELLPTFFQNGSQYNLGASVYLQIIPYFFFGKSIWVTRGTCALATVLAAISVGGVLKKVFKTANPWLGVLFLSVTPAWFLHSRTAFETALAVTCFAVFLYCYLCYRNGSLRYLYGAVIAAAAAFYSYSAARVVILAAGLLLFFSDIRYHWAKHAVVLRAAGLALLLALPFARFLFLHPTASAWQMRLLGSVWVSNVSLLEKLKTTLLEYLHGLDPLYWYLPNAQDLPRHVMSGYGHLLRPTLPLGLLGIGLALKNSRNPAYRALLATVIAAPAGAAFVHLGITRALFMVIPMALLTALATDSILEWLRRHSHISSKSLAAGTFLLLAGGNIYMLADALSNGPLWSRDFGLAGMQYGARQVFGEMEQILEQRPETKIVLSPSWANGTDVIARFFFSDPLPFELGSAEGYYSTAKTLDDNQLFIMTPEEFDDLPRNHFAQVNVEKIMLYPDGKPGFYFVRLNYAENIHQVIAREAAERHTPDYAEIWAGSDLIKIGYTKLDMGKIENAFDGDAATLVRTWAVNPMQLAIDFVAPRDIKKVAFQVGGTATRIEMQVQFEGEPGHILLSQFLPEATLPRVAQFDLPPAGDISHLVIIIQNANDTEDGHVHLWELSFQ
jgi:4-amino-4-deoxy-L-arabinose transferase-like glycosyltransferase